ncbi:unnamed protein product [Polarella glacialis]|uniref:BART domain-containing protein n=1 Tax=Polarella glacialis TaxID=89957 RepID=A0A813I2Y0_POLGL|nr:unnamed protein product [Polarella glacialis]CAE8644057.1 unnamed protein product [Polarella glacialis]|mmetsp:Transcript_36736/g.59221  ORF Transcript_36736/g.59221 Transcript_36736/m.59221 type:complete len:146 (-) Transcript_36736:53-490(-)
MAELPHAFLEHLKQNPHILESLRNFQAGYRGYFQVDSADGHTQEQRSAYLEFVNIVDAHLSAFLELYGASDEDFVAGLDRMKETQDPHWHAFNMVLQKTEFEDFKEMLRTDLCLCCGRPFNTPQHPDYIPPPPPPPPEGYTDGMM